MVLINLQCQLDFLFLLLGRDFFRVAVALLSFVEDYFLSNVNIGLVLNVDVIRLHIRLHSHCFDNLNKVENYVNCLFVID